MWLEGENAATISDIQGEGELNRVVTHQAHAALLYTDVQNTHDRCMPVECEKAQYYLWEGSNWPGR